MFYTPSSLYKKYNQKKKPIPSKSKCKTDFFKPLANT